MEITRKNNTHKYNTTRDRDFCFPLLQLQQSSIIYGLDRYVGKSYGCMDIGLCTATDTRAADTRNHLLQKQVRL